MINKLSAEVKALCVKHGDMTTNFAFSWAAGKIICFPYGIHSIHAAINNSLALARVESVMVLPPSKRANSSIRWLSSN